MTSLLPFLLVLGAALEGDQAFEEGLRLYRDVEFEQALFSFQEAATQPDRPDDDRVVLFTWLGLTYAALERDDAAERAFRDALRLDIEAALPEDAPPKLRESFDVLRATMRAELAPVETTPQPPADVEEPAAPPDGELKMAPFLLGGAGVAAGAALLAGGAAGLVLSLALDSVAVAEDDGEFQVDRIDALDRANGQLGTSYALFAVAGALVVGAGGLGAAAFLVE
jgi:tetratricopeptide (TPR) repeat protein